jgi:transcriptional regulator with XRE-family HTH domain
MHARLGVSPALVQLWVTGGVKNPSLESLERLCEAYKLDFTFVRHLLAPPAPLGMNPKVQDFPALIRWIADKHHHGAVHPIHKRMGVSPATVQLWARGGVKNPNVESLERLCDAYKLDFTFVRRLLRPPAPLDV